MAITAKVSSTSGTSATFRSGNNIRVLERRIAEGGSRGTLSGLTDVDASTATDGSVLIYDGVEAKFKTSTRVEAPNTGTIYVSGGIY